MKRKLACFLCMLLILSLVFAGCGNATADTPPETTDPAVEKLVPSREPVTVSEPVKIVFWHACTGEAANELNDQIRQFNSTNGKGITVEGIYKGGYTEILNTVKAGYSAGAVPNLVVTGRAGTETLATAGVLADFSGYVKRDNFDMENIPESLRYYSQYYPGKVIQFPYLVNVSITYYNKAYYPDGFPTTLEDWVTAARKISADNPGVYGMGLPLDVGYIQRPLVRGLGSRYITPDGTAADGLENGAIEKMMTDWKSWIDSGCCIGTNNTDFAGELMAGKLASFPISCVNTVDYAVRAKAAGIDLGYAPCVTYGGTAAGFGGVGICALASSTDQELAACWEFIKFLYEDEQVIDNTLTCGVVPVTYSAARSDRLLSYFSQYPGMQVAFDSLKDATFPDWSPLLIEWSDAIRSMCIEVITNGTMTPAEAAAQLKRRAALLFP